MQVAFARACGPGWASGSRGVGTSQIGFWYRVEVAVASKHGRPVTSLQFKAVA